MVTGKSVLLDKGEVRKDKQVRLFPVGSVCTYPTDERKCNCVCYAEQGEILNRYTHERIYIYVDR